MSTYLYLRCDAHDPPMYSDNVAQHPQDELPWLLDKIAHRNELATTEPIYTWTTGFEWWEANLIAFFKQHPKCPITIEDEYGTEYPAI